ncbi:MAG: ATP-dependent DNA helicase UvrD2 [Actinomycetota bacterium]|nr:ATP-dependent DNA helicase UvrD2 [Actinomycetota bacterium]
MDIEQILEGLNPEQQRAVRATRGPVCILAGAGSGKTTTVTRRIACQVLAGDFEPGAILAVTFTDKAAGEMRSRLEALGAGGVRARTFHAAALGQLRNLSEEPPGQILPSKGAALRQLGNSLPKPFRFRPAADLATEIEWAKNRRLTPQTYVGGLGDHEPPIPADLMESIFKRYERGKRDRSLVDFEDILELAIRLHTEDVDARELFQSRYQAFTVDEYQDVNLLQQTLLECWLGGRDDLCVVGDDYQSIYGFTGATPSHLLEMPRRFPRTNVVRLETNYRSTAQVLEFANRLVPKLGGAEKLLKASRDDGPEPSVRPFATPEFERSFVVEEIARLHEQGIAYEDIAVLYRVNFRSEDYEEAFAVAGIPFQVRGGSFLARPAARRLLNRLRPPSATDVFVRVAEAAEKEGWVAEVPEGLGEQETTRQNDFARLVRLAEEFDDGARTINEFIGDLRARFTSEGEGRGVNLLTLHRAKGLEFEGVFIVRLEEGELPFKRAKTDAAIDEERRLLYVGITRARRHLFVTRVVGGNLRPSRFLAELGIGPHSKGAPLKTAKRAGPDDPTVDALKRWRLQRSRNDSVPAYVVFHDSTLEAIAAARPESLVELSEVAGVGPTKLDRYGDEILETLSGATGNA